MAGTVSFRGVDERVVREFKAAAARRGMKMGEAITQAMEFFSHMMPSFSRKRLTDTPPVHWGKGTSRMSQEVDEVVYGWKKKA